MLKNNDIVQTYPRFMEVGAEGDDALKEKVPIYFVHDCSGFAHNK